MRTATNVDAIAVNTIEWLAADTTAIRVPVYQRQYRWDIGGCEQLLADVRAVAASEDVRRHFIGSILSAADAGDRGELVLIDGQQRITTLMLLVAAVEHTARASDPTLAAELRRVLTRTDDPQRTKLRPHEAWAELFEAVVLDRADDTARLSRFGDNYAFFRSQIHAEEARQIWRGLQKLEHVSITLGANAHAQQIFESLNSTGEPLRDHELIHNYVLMGLSHAEQQDIENTFWLPIENLTGESIGTFWRHYLVMCTGREITGEHGVYTAFRALFPRHSTEQLRQDAATWLAYAELYATLLAPEREENPRVRRQVEYVRTFGRAPAPLLLSAYFDYRHGDRDEAAFVAVLESVQAMYLRRTIVGIPTERLIARLCRARRDGADALQRAIARITPSDERVRAVLKYAELPFARYVLGRLLGVEDTSDWDVEHIVPLTPPDMWSGDGEREWLEYSEDEQNSQRTLAPTLGNLTLLEQPLAERAFNESFLVKCDTAYARSALETNAALRAYPAWNSAAISARTAQLSDAFTQLWARPAIGEIDDDGLTPVLDAVRRRGWPAGWEREFDYVEYRGEHWEVKDVRALFNRIFRRAWTDDRTAALAYCARHGGPIYEAMAWTGDWDALDETHFLYMGWDANYMMTALQGVLEESGIAAEVFVKYSYIGNVM